MKIVFADTGFWVALLNPNDELHDKALQLEKQIQPAHIVTSEMVLTELLNDFSKRGQYLRLETVRFIEKLKVNPNATVVPQSQQQLDRALSLYKERPDKAWSHTDCVSFLIMEQYQISEALAYDKHFVQAGYTALLRD